MNKKMINRITPSGTISLYDVRVELVRGGQISLNYSDVRKLGGRTSGQIAMSDLRGKSSQITYTLDVRQWPRETAWGFRNGTMGNIFPRNVEGSGLTLSEVFASDIYGNSVFSISLNGNKFTNKVGIVIDHFSEYTFEWSGNQRAYGDQNSNITTSLLNYFRSKNGGSVQVKFRWFN